MYLLYLDDSGSAQNQNEEYLVLGGVSIFERRAFFISQELDRLAATFNDSDPEAVEFHASEIFRGKTHPWSTLKTPAERKKVLHSVLKVLADDRYGTTAFACAVHKKSFPHDDPMHIAFEEICNRFDHQLRRMNATNEVQHRGLIVLDESSYETTLQSLAKDFRRVGTRWGVTRNLAEVPLFVNSKASRCIQLADHLAYAVFRRYDANDTSYIDPVLRKFDSEQGKLHGLVHKQTYDLSCMCPACMSRRLASPTL